MSVYILIVVSSAFALYVTCPRMTPMIATQPKLMTPSLPLLPDISRDRGDPLLWENERVSPCLGAHANLQEKYPNCKVFACE